MLNSYKNINYRPLPVAVKQQPMQLHTSAHTIEYLTLEEAAEQEDEKLQFRDWLPLTAPKHNWEWNHIQYIREHLDKVTSGEIKRLMIFVPPRHGKSELTTIHYAAYRLLQDEALRIVIGAYNSTLSEKFSRRIRGIVRQSTTLDRERNSAADWLTLAGGGVRAVGVGGGITGQGGDLIIIDDPVKSREEADSVAFRERAWSWYTDDLFTRLEPNASMILIMTRWHEDDLAGRILASEEGPTWTVIDLPAIAEEDDPLGRPAGAALCPERYDVDALEAIKRTLGPRGWSALYMQHPAPPEGSMFKRHWFPIVKALPIMIKRIRYWDLAGAEEGEGDYTVGLLLGMSADRRYWVEHIDRFQLSAHQRNQRIKQVAAEDSMRGVSVTYIEQAPGLAKEATDAVIQLLAGYHVIADPVTRDKISRAEPFKAQAEAGNISLLQGVWNTAYLDELAGFPYWFNDDQVDTSSGSFNKIAFMAELKQGANPLSGYRG
jgi:predicted phage terminase large subunit-like protein